MYEIPPRHAGPRYGFGPPRLLGLSMVLVLLLAAPQIGTAGEPRDELSRPIETDQAKAAEIAAANGGEVFRLRWKLAGFFGALAGLFVPSSGDALMTFVPRSDGRVEIQVLITAPKRDGEYFLYGADIDRSSGNTEAVWSSWVFRDRREDREQELDEPDIIDYASAIYHLRYAPPETRTEVMIWSGGKLYPVVVQPLEPEQRKIAGEKIEVRGYAVRGVREKGKSSYKDKLSLYFANDGRSTPVEITGKRGLVKVRIQLVEVESAGSLDSDSNRASTEP